VKIIGLSVDAITNHEKWADDIEETQGARPEYPIIGDHDFNASKLYGMLPASTSGDPANRTPADSQTVRNVFVIGPDNKVKLILVYPMSTGRNFDEVLRVIDSLKLTAAHKVSTPVNWQPGRTSSSVAPCPTTRPSSSSASGGSRSPTSGSCPNRAKCRRHPLRRARMDATLGDDGGTARTLDREDAGAALVVRPRAGVRAC
jgi:alkyl hydroperoxide reductase subunit AhpC